MFGWMTVQLILVIRQPPPVIVRSLKPIPVTLAAADAIGPGFMHLLPSTEPGKATTLHLAHHGIFSSGKSTQRRSCG